MSKKSRTTEREGNSDGTKKDELTKLLVDLGIKLDLLLKLKILELRKSLKLNELVLQLLELGVRDTQIQKLFGITQGTVGKIKSRAKKKMGI